MNSCWGARRETTFFSSHSTAFFECDSTMPPTAVTVHFKACVTSINNVQSVGVQHVISPSALLRQNNSILCLICHLTNAPLKGPQLPPTISPITAAVWLPACTCCVAQIYNVDSRFGYLHLQVGAVVLSWILYAFSNFLCYLACRGGYIPLTLFRWQQISIYWLFCIT